VLWEDLKVGCQCLCLCPEAGSCRSGRALGYSTRCCAVGAVLLRVKLLADRTSSPAVLLHRRIGPSDARAMHALVPCGALGASSRGKSSSTGTRRTSGRLAQTNPTYPVRAGDLLVRVRRRIGGAVAGAARLQLRPVRRRGGGPRQSRRPGLFHAAVPSRGGRQQRCSATVCGPLKWGVGPSEPSTRWDAPSSGERSVRRSFSLRLSRSVRLCTW
jgi:hypothetical protein